MATEKNKPQGFEKSLERLEAVVAEMEGGDLSLEDMIKRFEEGQKLIAPIREFGNPYGEHVGTQPFTDWQQAFDPLLTPGARNYWKSHNFTELDDDLLSAAQKPLSSASGVDWRKS